jgi:diguanylate cyclase (GGDEF)-like protein
VLQNTPILGNAVASSHLLFGAYAAVVAMTLLASTRDAIASRDPAHLLFALHVVLVGLGVSTLTGFAGHYLWPGDASSNATAAGAISWLCLCSAALLVRELAGDLGQRKFSMVLLAHSACCLLLALSAWSPIAGIPRGINGNLLAIGWVLLLASAAWYSVRRPAVGWRVFAGLGLLVAGAIGLPMGADGWPGAGPQAGVQLAAVLEIALVLAALRLRGRERHESRARLDAFARTDPLTGVGSQRALLDTLDDLLQRAARQHSLGAVLRVHVANLDSILERYGREAAEAAVMRAAECVSREAGEHDAVAREQGGDLVLVLNGRITRDQAAEAGRNIIARGLKFSNWLPPRVTLSLRIAAVCAPLPQTSGASLLAMLEDGLMQMARQRHGKALHFLDMELAQEEFSRDAEAAVQPRKCA